MRDTLKDLYFGNIISHFSAEKNGIALINLPQE